ncbi:MAG: hypothetical protein J6S09_10410 [Paludibacteraceae bacterium]|nr:hypothetical protein [Paludibacteraceae bacterium]
MRSLYLALLLLLAPPLFAQSLTITQSFREIANSSVLASFKNQFGAWENNGAFPYALIRVQLEGNVHEVIAAKQTLMLDLGGKGEVMHVYREMENEIMFLVPQNVQKVDILCGVDGERKNILTISNALQANTVYMGKVHYIPFVEKNITIQSESQYRQFFVFRLNPADAQVHVMVNGIEEIWENKDGIAYKMLCFGAYPYSISADGYYSQEGIINVSDQYRTLEVTLTPLPTNNDY